MNEKQQQLTFEKGITSVPSDAICSDNALEKCFGMVYDDGEHHVIQLPKKKCKINSSYRIVYVHKFGGEERLIVTGMNDDDGYLGYYKDYAGDSSSIKTFTSKPTAVTSIGKILIVTADNAIHYFLWKTDRYQSLDDAFGEPDIRFRICLTNRDGNNHPLWLSSIVDLTDVINDSGIVIQDKVDTYNDMIIGVYSKHKNRVSTAGLFLNPFFVRYAIELYDGGYIYISQPVLLLPSVTQNTYGNLVGKQLNVTTALHTGLGRLQMLANFDFSEWGDIIKGVSVFVSDEIDIYDLTVNQPFVFHQNDQLLLADAIGGSMLTNVSYYRSHSDTGQYEILAKKDGNYLMEQIKNVSVFYKIADIGIFSYDTVYRDITFPPHTLENLTTQPTLGEDDYFSRNPLYPSTLFTYNSRLNIANVSRGFFDGFGHFLPFDNYEGGINPTPVESDYEIFVTIETDNGPVTVKHEAHGTSEKQGIYFYYPDPRAKSVKIFKGNSLIKNVTLKEHPYLHGAYYYGINTLEGLINYIESGDAAQKPDYNNSAVEVLPNYVITSEVNNPFFFRAKGYFKVGTGKIEALSTVTQALSQGQFGDFPLLIFSEEGVWAASLNSEGYFVGVHPISRDTIYHDSSVMQTDNAVFFSSKKGLMKVAGSQVSCASEQLVGRNVYDAPSLKMFGKAIYAYDYRDSLLYIYPMETFYGHRPGTYAIVYSIRSGAFSSFRVSDEHSVVAVVSSYPDYLIQESSGDILSFSQRPNKNDDNTAYEATFITRPMKLENSMELKSIMQMRHIYQFSDGASMEVAIYASNNLKDWVQLTSLRGIPWKYYKFEYEFVNLKAVDTFAGTVIVTQSRRIDKLR